MNVCESNLQEAVETFMRLAHIPKPDGWSKTTDMAFLHLVIYPAYLESLKKIELVNLCAGFSIKNIKEE